MAFADDFPELAEIIPMEYQSAIYSNCLSREEVRRIINANFDNGIRDALIAQFKL